MKRLFIWILGIALLNSGAAFAQFENEQEKLGLPGDNLNLYAVMKLFQESPTLEEFEKKLNQQDARINNLDLNGDEKTDYIRVIDQVDGNVHNIILQVAVNEKENQDVAVFTVDRDEKGNVYIQLTGDEALYGKNYIIEPNVAENSSTPNPGYTGDASGYTTRTLDDKQIVVNNFSRVEVSAWPIVDFIFLPTYVVWRSPWYWGHYPGWWRPWRPIYWDFYAGYHYNWYNHYWGWYRRCPVHVRPYWNTFYYQPHRVYSPWVHSRYQSGYYRATYSRPDLRQRGMDQYVRANPSRPVLQAGYNRPAARPVMPQQQVIASRANRPGATSERLRPDTRINEARRGNVAERNPQVNGSRVIDRNNRPTPVDRVQPGNNATVERRLPTDRRVNPANRPVPSGEGTSTQAPRRITQRPTVERNPAVQQQQRDPSTVTQPARPRATESRPSIQQRDPATISRPQPPQRAIESRPAAPQQRINESRTVSPRQPSNDVRPQAPRIQSTNSGQGAPRRVASPSQSPRPETRSAPRPAPAIRSNPAPSPRSVSPAPSGGQRGSRPTPTAPARRG